MARTEGGCAYTAYRGKIERGAKQRQEAVRSISLDAVLLVHNHPPLELGIQVPRSWRHCRRQHDFCGRCRGKGKTV
jgi:hypothetical protein